MVGEIQDKIDVDLEDYALLTLVSKENKPDFYEISPNEIAINLASIDDDIQNAVLTSARKQFQDSKELLRDDIHQESDDIEQDQSASEVQEILSFFDGKIPSTYYNMLEASLLLQKAVERGKDVEPRRQDIYNKFGQEGINVNNLCNSGYFDEEGYLRELYYVMEKSDIHEAHDYREVFTRIIENTPFTVFVNTNQSAWDVQIEARDKVATQKRHRVEFDFVDIRGIGQTNIKTIRESIDGLRDWFGDFTYEEQIIENEIRVRINSDSIDGLPDLT